MMMDTKPGTASTNILRGKWPHLWSRRREKSSSLCGGGIPNLFMLTISPVIIPRASWPYAEPAERPITEETTCKMKNIRFEKSRTSSSSSLASILPPLPTISRSTTVANNNREDNCQQDENEHTASFACHRYHYCDSDSLLDSDSLSKRTYDPEDYHDTSSDIGDDETGNQSVTAIMKICKAIVHKTIVAENDDLTEMPTITITCSEENE